MSITIINFFMVNFKLFIQKKFADGSYATFFEIHELLARGAFGAVICNHPLCYDRLFAFTPIRITSY